MSLLASLFRLLAYYVCGAEANKMVCAIISGCTSRNVLGSLALVAYIRPSILPGLGAAAAR